MWLFEDFSVQQQTAVSQWRGIINQPEVLELISLYLCMPPEIRLTQPSNILPFFWWIHPRPFFGNDASRSFTWCYRLCVVLRARRSLQLCPHQTWSGNIWAAFLLHHLLPPPPPPTPPPLSSSSPLPPTLSFCRLLSWARVCCLSACVCHFFLHFHTFLTGFFFFGGGG